MPTQYIRAKQLLEAELGDEIVALDASRGQCYGFNPVAAEIWRLLETPHDFNQLRGLLLDQFEVSRGECTADLKDHLDELEREGLIRRIDDPQTLVNPGA